MRIWLDTDLGTNIDDALALLYLGRRRGVRLVGVSTVTAPARARAALARRLLDVLGLHTVPVLVGAERPLAGEQGQPLDPSVAAWVEAEGLDGSDLPAFDVGRLAGALGDGPAAVVAIGPLTNIAGVVQACGDLVSGVSLGWMGGCVGAPPPGYGCIDTNLRLDPVAAQVALAAPWETCRIVPLDVTVSCRVPADVLMERLRGHVPAEFAALLEFWRRRRNEVVLHDPLTAGAVVDPRWCRWEPVEVVATSDQGQRPIQFRPAAGGRGPCHLAREADAGAFVDHYLTVVTRGGA